MTPNRAPRISPFSTGKWEYERTRNFYYLGSKEYRRLASTQKHCFLIGHRGTGKTTLLRSLDWRERTGNEQLSACLNHDPFADGTVGCYIGLKHIALQLFEGWLSQSTVPVRHLMLGSYLRSLWLEEAALAVRRVAARYSAHTLSDELAALDDVADQFEDWLPDVIAPQQFDTADQTLTLRRVHRVAASLRDYLHSQATLALLPPEDVVVKLRLNRLQELTNRVFLSFAHVLSRAEPAISWTFRVCMDEGEFLEEPSRLTIRTLVRECESPLFIAVAALSDLGIDTVAPNVSLTLDDRYVLDLDKRRLPEMQDLINGIVAARVAQSRYDCANEFDIARLLGDPDLNDLLLAIRSENQEFSHLQQRWIGRRGDGTWDASARGSSPIREYLEQTGSIDPPTPDAPVSRAADSAGYRKKKLAGYLGLLNAYGIRHPLYAGWRISLHMADNSIRDLLFFLEQSREAWCAGDPTRSDGLGEQEMCRFLGEVEVPWHIQDTALARLGSEKLSAFEEKVIHFTSHARRLVDFFGRLAHHLDSGTGVVALPLPSMFIVRVPGGTSRPKSRADLDRMHLPSPQQAFLDIVSECSEEGFLKLERLSPATGEIHLRMHLSLARYYGFSFRRPIYSTRIDWGAVETVLSGPADANLERLVARALARRARSRTGRPRIAQQGQAALPFRDHGNSDDDSS